MRRSLTILTGLVLGSALVATTHATAFAQETKSNVDRQGKSRVNQATREQFFSAEAALFSALAHTHALDEITEGQDNPDFSLCRNLIATIGRSIQGVDSSSVSMGQADHSLEKSEAMKTLRAELNEATKAAGEAHQAADGHGPISPHAKNMMAHLLKATQGLVDLAEEIGIDHIHVPGTETVK